MMKITRSQLRRLIKESLDDENPYSIERQLKSNNLEHINQGIDLAIMMGDIPDPISVDIKQGRKNDAIVIVYEGDDVEIFINWIMQFMKTEDSAATGEAFYQVSSIRGSSTTRVLISLKEKSDRTWEPYPGYWQGAQSPPGFQGPPH